MGLPQKTGNETTTPSWRLASKLQQGLERTFAHLLSTAALFSAAKRWKQPKGPSRNERVNEMWPIHTLGYIQPEKGRKP